PKQEPTMVLHRFLLSQTASRTLLGAVAVFKPSLFPICVPAQGKALNRSRLTPAVPVGLIHRRVAYSYSILALRRPVKYAASHKVRICGSSCRYPRSARSLGEMPLQIAFTEQVAVRRRDHSGRGAR